MEGSHVPSNVASFGRLAVSLECFSVFFLVFLQMPRRRDALPHKMPSCARQNDTQVDKSCLLTRWQETNFHGAHLVCSLPVCWWNILEQRSDACRVSDVYTAKITIFSEGRWEGGGGGAVTLKDGGQNFEVCDTGEDVSWFDFPLMCCWNDRKLAKLQHVLNMSCSSFLFLFFLDSYCAMPLILSTNGLAKLFTRCHDTAPCVWVLKQLHSLS